MNRLLLIILFFTVFGLSVNAQEVLIGLDGNPVLQNAVKQNPQLIEKSLKAVDVLELPFFDDFALMTTYPNQNKWIGRDVFINDTWGKDPISYGVASFDIADSIGVIRALSSGGELSDVLTSYPINLNYSAGDSVYFSFAVQRGGNARGPEEQDSLVLQFNSPDTVWHSVWNMSGGVVDTAFQYFLIPITQNYLLVDEFQFRFKNYGSTEANSYEPSFNSNNDVWNLDYVWIDTARSIIDTIIEDIAMIKNLESLLKDYESVPWKHFKANPQSVQRDSLVFVYKNNGLTEQAINRQYEITDLWGNGDGDSDFDDSENIVEYQTIRYSKFIDYVYDSDSEDSASFELKGFISTDDEVVRKKFRWNDTVYYHQDFKNYYAYDDGIPEVGYGIGGNGTSSAAVAYQFEPIIGDSLRGVNIYFNKVLNDENIHYFYLTIWDDNDGLPGDTLYQQIGVKPIHEDSLFQYHYYALDTAIYVSNTFHIGWIKTTNDMLNVGFDESRDASEHININLFGDWQQTSMTGALMIRPVFGEDLLLSFAPENIVDEIEIKCYPNPVSTTLEIETNENYDFSRLISSTGIVVDEKSQRTQFEVSSFAEGFYILLFYRDGVIISRQKLLIRH